MKESFTAAQRQAFDLAVERRGNVHIRGAGCCGLRTVKEHIEDKLTSSNVCLLSAHDMWKLRNSRDRMNATLVLTSWTEAPSIAKIDRRLQFMMNSKQPFGGIHTLYFEHMTSAAASSLSRAATREMALCSLTTLRNQLLPLSDAMQYLEGDEASSFSGWKAASMPREAGKVWIHPDPAAVALHNAHENRRLQLSLAHSSEKKVINLCHTYETRLLDSKLQGSWSPTMIVIHETKTIFDIEAENMPRATEAFQGAVIFPWLVDDAPYGQVVAVRLPQFRAAKLPAIQRSLEQSGWTVMEILANEDPECVPFPAASSLTLFPGSRVMQKRQDGNEALIATVKSFRQLPDSSNTTKSFSRQTLWPVVHRTDSHDRRGSVVVAASRTSLDELTGYQVTVEDVPLTLAFAMTPQQVLLFPSINFHITMDVFDYFAHPQLFRTVLSRLGGLDYLSLVNSPHLPRLQSFSAYWTQTALAQP